MWCCSCYKPVSRERKSNSDHHVGIPLHKKNKRHKGNVPHGHTALPQPVLPPHLKNNQSHKLPPKRLQFWTCPFTIPPGPRAPARQMVVRITLCPCLEGREDPENQPNPPVMCQYEGVLRFANVLLYVAFSPTFLTPVSIVQQMFRLY